MTAAIRLTIIVSILIASIYLCKRFRRKQLLDLRWPARIGFSKLNRLVKDYLESNGWQILMPDMARHVFIAKRADCTIQIRCESSETEFTMSKIRDLRHEAMTRKPWPLLCITVQKVPTQFVQYAASGHVAIIHYKHLKVFGRQYESLRGWAEAIRDLQATENPASLKSQAYAAGGLFEGNGRAG